MTDKLTLKDRQIVVQKETLLGALESAVPKSISIEGMLTSKHNL